MAKGETSGGLRRLVIVESPAKAQTIESYLGEGYQVEASVGHIRDLPQPSELPAEMKKGPFGKFAVNVDDDFTPYYVVDSGKKKKVSELKAALRNADELYLATDEDREGEAIAWHLLQALKPKVPVRRMVFSEITREAINRALENPREVNEKLVDAQETRRILDRLYGYEISPVLWRKVRNGLSAGRVQSVATRMVVQRERERMAFKAAEYWDVAGRFHATGDGADSTPFKAKLVTIDGTKVAVGRDFNDGGELTTDAVVLTEHTASLVSDACERAEFTVRRVDTKPYRRRPAAPFTTSTLQQEASRKLRFSAKQTMRTAQSLYENGYITYMRTDSVVLSDQALSAARRQAAELYGADSVADKPRIYAKKSKNSQEAHEAIRPAGENFRRPSQVAGSLRPDEQKLYDLIWKRTVASQMEDARGQTATIRLGAHLQGTDEVGTDAEFTASGTVITFRGFLAAYEEGTDEQRNRDDDNDHRLPNVDSGDALAASELAAAGHHTSPPPRYTEASLVKALEERGIGRPSTYAATISVIVDRGYVGHRGNALVPSWLAFAVTRLLEEHFTQFVDYEFTASMEEDLDRIASGEQDRVRWLHSFYFGADGEQRSPGIPSAEGLKSLVEDLGEIDAREISTVPIGEGIVLRVGRYGPYLERAKEGAEDPERASVPEDIAPDELTLEKANELFTTHGEGDHELGADPESGHQIIAKNGRFGPYVTEVLPEEATKGRGKQKPRTASLFKTMSVDTVTLEQALQLLSLPRVVGVDPESGEEITAQNGRYGPYLKKGKDSRSIDTEEQIFSITLEEAQKIYAQPKRGRGGRAAKPPLRELGKDPVTDLEMVVKDGRFGPYVTDGETNATLKGGDTPESVTPERASQLLADRRAAGPKKKTAKKAAKKTAKKSVKKTAAKKSTAKKVATKKTAAKKTTKKATARKATKKAATKKSAVKKTTEASDATE